MPPQGARQSPLRFVGGGRWALGLSVALAVACGGARPGTRSADDRVQAPGVTVDHAIAEGSGDPPTVESLLDAASEPPPKRPSRAAPPDPEPLQMAEQWEYALLYQGGTIVVEAVRRQVYPKPVATERRMGRYAIELWIGAELIERVRFDFPGLAAEEPPTSGRQPLHAPLGMAAGAEVRTRVRVPASPRARRAVLVDRATEEETPLSWPPNPGAPSSPEPGPSDAGSPR